LVYSLGFGNRSFDPMRILALSNPIGYARGREGPSDASTSVEDSLRTRQRQLARLLDRLPAASLA
jgi:hypothetical protein